MATDEEDSARTVSLAGALHANSQEALGTEDVPDTGAVHGDDDEETPPGGHLGEDAIALSGD